MRGVILISALLIGSGCATVEGWLGLDEEEHSAGPSSTSDAGSNPDTADAVADIGLEDTIALPDAVNTDCDLVPTFSSIQEKYLGPSCTFASCHDADKPAGDLDLTEGNSYDSLVNMAAAADATETLVVIGDPDASYLVKRVEGTASTFMPQGVQEPMDPGCRIATLRAWILAGAPDN